MYACAFSGVDCYFSGRERWQYLERRLRDDDPSRGAVQASILALSPAVTRCSALVLLAPVNTFHDVGHLTAVHGQEWSRAACGGRWALNSDPNRRLRGPELCFVRTPLDPSSAAASAGPFGALTHQGALACALESGVPINARRRDVSVDARQGGLFHWPLPLVK